MMKHLKNLIFFVLLTTVQFAYSFEGCDPCSMETSCDLCNARVCDLELEFFADALYWRGCSSSLYYNSSEGKAKALDPDYGWGWRVGGSVYWNTWDLGVRYTSFSSKTTDDFYINNEVVVTSKYKIDYDVFDVEIGRACCICEGISLRPFVGGKFADIHIKHKNIFDIDELYRQKLDASGLYLGFDGRWQMCSFNVCDRCIPVTLVSRLSIGVLEADFDADFDELTYKDCQFIPANELFAGLEFRLCGLCNADAFFQVGYEAQYWGWKDVGDYEDIAHLGLGGLVLRLGANF